MLESVNLWFTLRRLNGGGRRLTWQAGQPRHQWCFGKEKGFWQQTGGGGRNQMDIAEKDKAGVMLWSIYGLPWGLPNCHLLAALDHVTVWLVQCPVSTLLPLATVRNFKTPFTKPFGPVVTQVQVRSC